jgi:hypothetical protein
MLINKPRLLANSLTCYDRCHGAIVEKGHQKGEIKKGPARKLCPFSLSHGVV